MITEAHKQTARLAMEFALQNGCSSARVSLCNSSCTAYEVRNTKLENLQQATEYGLAIQLFVEGRYCSASTNRLNGSELRSFIANCISSARYLARDEARMLPDPSLYFKGKQADLQLYDPQMFSIAPEAKINMAISACEEIYGRDKRVVSATSAYSDVATHSYMVASNGFEGETSVSCCSLSAEASVRGQGDARPASHYYEASTSLADLKTDDVGGRALRQAIEKIGQQKVASAQMYMAVSNNCSANLLLPIMNAIQGAAIQQNSSFLIGKKGVRVLGDNVKVIDEPHLPKAIGSRYYDTEGVATRRTEVFSSGVLNTYYTGVYYANKLNVSPTVGSPSVLTMPLGERNAEAIIKSIDKGILVTGFNGGNCNPVTGDFSYGVEGFLVEHGELSHPVSEMNITGNMLSLWKSLVETGNDARTVTNRRIPTLLFENVNFSGK